MKASTNRSPMHRKLGLLAAALAFTLSGCSMLKPDDARPPPAPGAPILGPALPDKGDPQARFSAAMELWQRNDVAEAETALKALTTDFPEFSGPWTNLGILYAKSNRRPLAVAALSRAASLNAKNDVAFNWLGILNREAGDLERARLAYQKALDANPDSALAHYNLAILLDAHLKQPQAALPHYAAYQKLSAGDDLKVLAWVAEIKAATPPEQPPEPVQTPGNTP